MVLPARCAVLSCGGWELGFRGSAQHRNHTPTPGKAWEPDPHAKPTPALEPDPHAESTPASGPRAQLQEFGQRGTGDVRAELGGDARLSGH
ncbi:hypothetical protein GCM10027271_09670 [Saccharopolyspora gloriosae]